MFFRTMSILPLLGRPRTHDHDPMFDVFCRRHASRVLLSTDNIEALLNRPDGLELHWHCWCGERGVRQVHKVTAAAGR